MEDRDDLERADAPDDTGEPREPYVPASFEKRAAAWMGLGYMAILLFLITFAIFTGGKGLPGTFPLLLVPVSVAGAVIAIHRARRGMSPIPLTVLIVCACGVAAALGLALGVPALVAALQNAYA